MNPETGEISLNLDLNSKTGEESPDRGVHAAKVAGAPRLESSGISRLAAEPGLLEARTTQRPYPAHVTDGSGRPEHSVRYPPDARRQPGQNHWLTPL